jgi:hypothetical protein
MHCQIATSLDVGEIDLPIIQSARDRPGATPTGRSWIGIYRDVQPDLAAAFLHDPRSAALATELPRLTSCLLSTQAEVVRGTDVDRRVS